MMEFVALIMFLMAAYIVFQKYIVRGLSGRWKSVGDALGQGRIYDPRHTTECAYKTFFQGVPPVWFDQECFEAQCEDECLRTTKNSGDCTTCLTVDCQNDLCDP